MLLAINSDRERLECGSQLGLSAILLALLCPPLRVDLWVLVPYLGPLCAEIQFRSQAAETGGQGDQEGLTAETRMQAPQKGNS